MKCATTSLWARLSSHPQIFMPPAKDIGFFSYDEIFARGWAWYEAHFSVAHGRLAIGEGSTSYTMRAILPDTSRRIAAHLPHAKLIYIVRHPLERLESHWRHATAVGYSGSLEEFLEQPDVVDISCYWRQISAYRTYFPDEQILVLFFEEFVKDTDATVRRCFEFLGVDPAFGATDSDVAMNISRDKRVNGPLIHFVRTLPGIQSLKRTAPRLSKAVGRALRRTMPEGPVWRQELRNEVIGQLSGDAANFLRHYGKPADWWRLD